MCRAAPQGGNHGGTAAEGAGLGLCSMGSSKQCGHQTGAASLSCWISVSLLPLPTRLGVCFYGNLLLVSHNGSLSDAQ